MIAIRDARPADADALAALCTQLGYPASAADMPARLERLAEDPLVRVLVASDDGRVVGLITTHLRHTMNHAAPLAQITLLVVDEACRGKGVGAALVQASEAWARERGCRRITVTTALHRGDAHAFYEKMKYAHTGRRYGKDFTPPSH